MKRFYAFLAALCLAATVPAIAQDEQPAGTWSRTSTTALKFSESMFNNWSSTGTSQLDLNATFFGN